VGATTCGKAKPSSGALAPHKVQQLCPSGNCIGNGDVESSDAKPRSVHIWPMPDNIEFVVVANDGISRIVPTACNITASRPNANNQRARSARLRAPVVVVWAARLMGLYVSRFSSPINYPESSARREPASHRICIRQHHVKSRRWQHGKATL
jgi:hypothetical protein